MRFSIQTVWSIGFLMLILTASGCGGGTKKDDGPGKNATTKAGEEGHHHHHGASAGPHKGVLVELGEEEYHAEFVHEDAAHRLTIYILDNKPEKNVPIEQKQIVLKLQDGKDVVAFTLPAKPLDDEKDGKSSRFELVDEKMAELVDKKGVTGLFNVSVVAGKPYIGKFTAEEHEEAKDKK